MADTTLEQVEKLAMQLAPEDQRLLIANLAQRLIKQPVSDSNLRDTEIRQVLDETRGAWGTGRVDRRVRRGAAIRLPAARRPSWRLGRALDGGALAARRAGWPRHPLGPVGMVAAAGAGGLVDRDRSDADRRFDRR